MLNIFYGLSGTGKSYEMMNSIKNDAEAGRQVCVIVPDQFTFEYERKLYNHLGCALFNNNKTEVWSFSRLTRCIFARTRAVLGRPADPTVKTAVLYRAIKDAAECNMLLYYRDQAKRASFVNTAAVMISELIHSGITPVILGDIIGKAPENMKNKLGDILEIYTRYDGELEKLGMRDPLSDSALAAEYAAKNSFFADMRIYMDEFKSFTGDQYKLIGVMLSQCAELTVCMTTDDPESKRATPFKSVNETARRLINIAEKNGSKAEKRKFTENKRYRSAGLAALPEYLLRLPKKNDNKADGSDITIFEAADIYGECDFVCAQIRELAGKNGYRFRDIAVLDRNMNDDISILAAHFERYGIPYYSDKKQSAAHMPIMLMISAALELAAGRYMSTEAVLRYAKSGLTELSGEEISRLENYCYRWDIDGEMWDSGISEEEQEKYKDVKEYKEIKEFCEISSRLTAPIKEMREKCSGASGPEICAALRKLISETDIEKKLRRSNGRRITDAAEKAEARDNERLLESLDSIISGLEAAIPGKISLGSFREVFMLAAAGITLAEPPQSLDAVAAQQSDLARLSEPRVVFVIHANDGEFPKTVSESVTFSEREREFFKNEDHDLSGDMIMRMSEERFNAVKALCSPSEKLFICYSQAQPSGAAMYPSALIGRIKGCFDNIYEINQKGLDMVFYCRTMQSAYTAAAVNFDSSNEQFAAVRSELSKDEYYRGRFGYIDSICEGTEHEVKDRELIKKLYGGKLKVSPSRFEDHVNCPFMYFCKTGLKLYPLKKMGLDPLNRGSIMHACMKDILEANKKAKFIGMSDGELMALIKESADKYIAENLGGSFGKKDSFRFFMENLTENVLLVLRHTREEMKVSEFVPDSFELPVGTDKEILINCGDWDISFGGTADRVDVFSAGSGEKYIRIIDYKTGKKAFDPRQLEIGLNMQMFFYLFMLTEKGQKYDGYSPAGALYVPARFPKLAKERLPDTEKTINSGMRMQGLILCEREIIEAMEKGASERGRDNVFIPVKVNVKDGAVSAASDVADRKCMNEVKKLTEKALVDMGCDVAAGKFPARPLVPGKKAKDSPCRFCDYKDICGNGGAVISDRDLPDKKDSIFSKDKMDLTLGPAD